MKTFMPTPTRMSTTTPRRELTLSGALADPLIRTLMAADKVDPVKLESMLSRIARGVVPSPTASIDFDCACGV